MCGIAGLVGRITDQTRMGVERTAYALRHRGPDHQGLWASGPSGDDGCLLAHRRLSILDLSHAADQPMTDPARGQTMVFNGEIYNYLELRRQLENRGEHFASTGDTAVMLRLLSLDGPAAVEQLRGMFAFALWDPQLQQLTLARDPLGIKPMYLAVNPDPDGEWKIIFGSEVRSLLACGILERPRLNPQAVGSVIWNGFVMGPQTAIAGIVSLEPGEVRTINLRGQTVARKIYWQMPLANTSPPIDVGELGNQLEQCVKLHLASDVPLGIFLSGGIDSSALANLAQRASDQPIHTFTLAFEEKEMNEAEYSRAIAAAIGTQHHEIVLSEKRFVEHLPAALATIDQPTFDGLNSYYMSQAVREAGLTVALVGTGGDELFGGYATFRDVPRLLNWSRRLSWVPMPLRRMLARFYARRHSPGGGLIGPQTRFAKLPAMIGCGRDIASMYQLAYALFLPGFQQELCNGPISNLGLGDTWNQRLRSEIEGRPPLEALSILEQRLFLGQRLLRDSDAASMAVSLELRTPLVDSVLTEQVMRLNTRSRYYPLGRKQILRDIGLKGLSPTLFERPKRGFELPFDRWIRKGLAQPMRDTLLDATQVRAAGLNPAAVEKLWRAFEQNAPGLYWSRLWAVYVLVDWCQRYGVAI